MRITLVKRLFDQANNTAPSWGMDHPACRVADFDFRGHLAIPGYGPARAATGLDSFSASALEACPNPEPLAHHIPAASPYMARGGRASWLTVFADLVKARLTSLVLVTTGTGLFMGSRGPLSGSLLFGTILGTGLVAGGAAALNQCMECDLDAKMHRTQHRPLPAGDLQPGTALAFGLVSSMLGLLVLAFFANGLTSLIGAITLLVYLFIYTPLKRITPLNTWVGAIPGAMPPLMGWTAARGELSSGGWALFAILFFWQIPHFLAIAWLYREDYARAGFAMLPVLDRDGTLTSRWAAGHALALLPVSLAPALIGLAGGVYVGGALGLGLLFLGAAWQFARELTPARARRLFYISLIYLPALLGLLAMDKIQY